MNKTLLENESFDFIQSNDELFILFKNITDKPKLVFESLEKYLYEIQGLKYVEKLASLVIKEPASYDQRLRYSLEQFVPPPREALYTTDSYYCQNQNRSSNDIFDTIKYAIGMYSDGKTTSGISDYLQSSLKNQSFDEVDLSDKAQYFLISSLLCLSQLLEIRESAWFKQMQKLASQDRLLDLYFHQRRELDMNIAVLHQDPYLFLSLEISREDSYIEQFLINFYNAIKTVPWYNAHKGDFSEFFGYWSFEIAYLVRFLGVIDSSFIDNKFYPRDLALRKWIPSWRMDKYGEEAQLYKDNFIKRKQAYSEALTKELLNFIEKETTDSIGAILSSDLLNKTMSKIAESNVFFQSIEKDPSEKEFTKIRSFISELGDLLTEYTDKFEENKHLNDLKIDIQTKVLRFFEKKKYNKKEVEQVLNEYLNSKSFIDLSNSNNKKIIQFSKDLKKAQSIENEENYWNELEQLFERNNLFNRIGSSPKVSNTKMEKKDNVSFKISFNDYL